MPSTFLVAIIAYFVITLGVFLFGYSVEKFWDEEARSHQRWERPRRPLDAAFLTGLCAFWPFALPIWLWVNRRDWNRTEPSNDEKVTHREAVSGVLTQTVKIPSGASSLSIALHSGPGGGGGYGSRYITDARHYLS